MEAILSQAIGDADIENAKLLKSLRGSLPKKPPAPAALPALPKTRAKSVVYPL